LLLTGQPGQAQTPSPTLQTYRTTISYQPVGVTGCPLIRLTFPHDAEANFVLDTGADISVITDTLAERLGLHPKPFTGPDGKLLELNNKPVQMVDVAMHIGDIPFEVPMIVLPAKTIVQAATVPVDGLIGTSTLGQLAVHLDFEQHQITLIYPGNLPSEELRRLDMAYADVFPKAPPDKRSFSISVRLNDQADTELVVDTGASATYLPLRVVKQLNLMPLQHSVESTTVYGNLKKNTARIQTLALGHLVVNNVIIEYSEHEQAGFPPHIGMDVLQRYSVLIDYPANKLYLQPALEARLGPGRAHGTN
jgi:predicted aspartyl protease